MISIVSEVFALIMLSIILFGLYGKQSNYKVKERFFILLIWVNIFACIWDILSRLLEGKKEFLSLLFTTNILSLISGSLLVICAGYYIVALINEKKKVSFLFSNCLALLNLICIVSVIILSFKGMIFTLPNGIYQAEKYFPVVFIGTGASIISCWFYVIKHRKLLSSREFFSMLVYITMPLISSVIEAGHPELTISFTASALSILFVYVLLQAQNMVENKLREEILLKLSFMDTMTSVQNRRACDEWIQKNVNTQGVNIVFGDINGLKETNDTLGHQAGDQLILRFTELLKKSFPKESIYRMSGDEFLVLYVSNEQDFMERVMHLKELSSRNNQIASIGYCIYQELSIFDLVKMAEQSMYEEKNAYYRQKAVQARGKEL